MSGFNDLSILPIKPPPQKNTMKFHPNLPDINTGACILHTASPKQGKSTLICNLLQNPAFYAGCFDEVYIFSATMSNGDETCRFLCEQYKSTIYSDYMSLYWNPSSDFRIPSLKNSDRKSQLFLMISFSFRI
jgi:replicative DNA helicase